jgi:hypothetical protein
MRKRFSAIYLLVSILVGLGLSQLHSSRAIAADPPAARKTEPKYKVIKTIPSFGAEAIEEILNNHNAKGWKFHSMASQFIIFEKD